MRILEEVTNVLVDSELDKEKRVLISDDSPLVMVVSQLPIHWYDRRSGAAANKQELVRKNGGQEKDLSAEINMKSAFRILGSIFES